MGYVALFCRWIRGHGIKSLNRCFSGQIQCQIGERARCGERLWIASDRLTEFANTAIKNSDAQFDLARRQLKLFHVMTDRICQGRHTRSGTGTDCAAIDRSSRQAGFTSSNDGCALTSRSTNNYINSRTDCHADGCYANGSHFGQTRTRETHRVYNTLTGITNGRVLAWIIDRDICLVNSQGQA